jgi:hypothetical protein
MALEGAELRAARGVRQPRLMRWPLSCQSPRPVPIQSKRRVTDALVELQRARVEARSGLRKRSVKA